MPVSTSLSPARVRATEHAAPLPGDVPVAVCVPVRDERAHLDALFDALAAQTIGAHAFTLCLLFDGCTDGGSALAYARRQQLPFDTRIQRIRRHVDANAGRARRAAMRLGSSALATHAPGLLLSTDADSIPAPDWVIRNLESLRSADVVAGYIDRPDALDSEAHRRLERYWERLRCLERTIDPVPHDPAPSHAAQGGASLAFRAGVYTALGGFEAVAAHEDVRLVTAARRAGYRVRHDRRVRVATSSRLDGRARDGLADTLRQRLNDRALPQVENPDRAAERFAHSAFTRLCFARIDDASVRAALAARLDVPASHVADAARHCPNAEAFAMALVPAPTPDTPGDTALEVAEAQLAQLEQRFRCPAA